MKKFNKQPKEVLDYDIDASDWLTQGDNVIGAVVTVNDPDIIIDDTIISDDRLKIWLSAGIDGVIYKVTAVITTEDGRSKEVDFQIKVKEL